MIYCLFVKKRAVWSGTDKAVVHFVNRVLSKNFGNLRKKIIQIHNLRLLETKGGEMGGTVSKDRPNLCSEISSREIKTVNAK